MAQNNWVGKTLSDRYLIEELLGQGGMSAVYKARDPNLGRVVAVKLIHQHLSNDNEFVRRFEEEAKAVAQLRHPNIIQVYDFNQDDGTYYMVLEFVPGETLQERLRRLDAEGRGLTFDEAAGYALETCQAVDYAHHRGMIHRDIKPANIMLDIYGKAILMDFGIAKIVGGDTHTATGAVIGTALYLSPEQIRGEQIDERVDVYAIGVTLFEMLNGKPPYEADSAMTLMMKHLNDPIPDLRELQPNVPEDLIAVVEKALAKDRNQRYRTAAAMATDLQKVIERLQSDRPLVVASVDSPETDEQSFLESPETAEVTKVEAATVASASSGSTVAKTDVPEAFIASTTPDDLGQVEREVPATARVNTPPPGLPVDPEGQASVGRRRSNLYLILGAVALVIVLLCFAGGGVFAYSQLSNNGQDNNNPTQIGSVLGQDVTPTEEVVEDTPIPSSATFTSAPPTETPTPTLSLTPTLSPTPTVPEGVPYVRINGIELDSAGNYFVDYETFGFTDELLLDGYHMTFFFDDLSPEEVGAPHETPYYMYAGPIPFDKFNLLLQSDEAENICVLVTKPDHTVVQESGTCYPLPDPQGIVDEAVIESLSYTDTPTVYPTATKQKKEKDNDY